MDKKKQRIAAIVIGILISIFLIIIGVRIMQGRTTQASAPQNASCSRSGTTATFSWDSQSCESAIVNYGVSTSSEMPFLAEEPQQPQQKDAGVCAHSVDIKPLAEDKEYRVAVAGFTDQAVLCPPAVANSQVSEGPTPALTTGPTATPTLTPTPTIAANLSTTPSLTSGIPLPITSAKDFYAGNTSAGYLECVRNFASTAYTSLAYICTQAYDEINSSTGSN